MQRYLSQTALFAARPSRLAVMKAAPNDTPLRTFKVNVWRNHAIEPILSLTHPYMAFGGMRGEFSISDYDDSLMFIDHRPADAEILWLDSTRYLGTTRFEAWLEWLVSRIRHLRTLTPAPVVLATWFEEAAHADALKAAVDRIPGAYLADLREPCREAGTDLIDVRSASVSGTPIGGAAHPFIARKLGCHWLPAALVPGIKALALDLDQTLYSGILGEDGIPALELTEAHSKLQSYVKALRQRGIFLGVVSRNEKEDAELLFATRGDFPLKREDFTTFEVSWQEKSTSLERMAQALRISTDAILFIDDNAGELAQVTQKLPGIHTLHAGSDVEVTLRTLDYYPGLWRWKTDSDDANRVNDLEANSEREALLQATSSPEEYFKELGVALIFRYDPAAQLPRLASLCGKTNQFNLALRRLNEAELSKRLENPASSVVSIHLKDRLSDSGIIAVIAASRTGSDLVVEEVCISCRALGRKLEDTMILQAIRGMPIYADAKAVRFAYNEGPRNQPAARWLAEATGTPLPLTPGEYALSKTTVDSFSPVEGILISQETPE